MLVYKRRSREEQYIIRGGKNMQYEIIGTPFPVVSISLDAGESMLCQKGGMAWKSTNVTMQTSGGGIGKMFSKAISGESMFQNTYTAEGGPGKIAIGTSVPGNVLPIKMENGKVIIAQKSAFLASEPGVSFEMFFHQKLSAGFFGGEGFIMQKFMGNGMLFLEMDGSVVEFDLAPSEKMQIDTGYLAAMEGTVQMSVETVKGIGNVVLGGEGLFITTVTGPGHIWLQTLPISGLANALKKYLPTSN